METKPAGRISENGMKERVFIFRFSVLNSAYEFVIRDAAGREHIVRAISADEIENSKDPEKSLLRFVNESLHKQILSQEPDQSGNISGGRHQAFDLWVAPELRSSKMKQTVCKSKFCCPSFRLIKPALRKLVFLLRTRMI